MKPFPTQISGAAFLAERRFALLADAPRVGKTGAAIMACDMALDASILVVTTASGRPVWRKAWADWSAAGRSVQVMTTAVEAKGDVVIVGWPQIAEPKFRAELLKRKWPRLILDESHAAKNFDAKRTQAVYGQIEDSGDLRVASRLVSAAGGTWCLTGTPLPNSPADVYPMMRALCPERLAGNAEKQWPDVTAPEAFLNRYTIRRPMKTSQFRSTMIVVGGKNEDELRARLDGFILLRTQADVGIREPIYDLMPLGCTDAMRRLVERDVPSAKILAAIEAGDTKSLDMHMGPLRRLTGGLKVDGVIQAVKDEFDGGLDKIVLAYWHKDVGDALVTGLSKYGVRRIDGATDARDREEATAAFARADGPRVFLAQIQAAGEAIDLSASAVLWFVESSFVPAAMAQMSKRITNFNQVRQPFVKVCTLENSIDEAVQASLMRKWASIGRVVKQETN